LQSGTKEQVRKESEDIQFPGKTNRSDVRSFIEVYSLD